MSALMNAEGGCIYETAGSHKHIRDDEPFYPSWRSPSNGIRMDNLPPHSVAETARMYFDQQRAVR